MGQRASLTVYEGSVGFGDQVSALGHIQQR